MQCVMSFPSGETIMSSITIYGVARSRASRNIWLMNELGQEFTHVPVIQAYRLAHPDAADAPLNTRSPSFLEVNPNGHVPSMADGDLVLHESLAINLYLARKYGGPVAARDLAEEGLLAMWTLWAATEAEPHTIQILYNRVMKPEAERDAALAERSVAALKAPFAVLDKALAATGFVMGGRFTVADINVAEVFRYAMAAPELFAAAPHVKKWLEACHERAGYKAMMAMRMAEPE
jgi:glutathione S-transferase